MATSRTPRPTRWPFTGSPTATASTATEKCFFQNPQVFSNSVVTALDPDPQYKWIPEMLDGDEHKQWRRRQLGLTTLPLIWDVEPPSPGDQPELR